MKRIDNFKFDKDIEQLELSYTGGSITWYNNFVKLLVSNKAEHMHAL